MYQGGRYFNESQLNPRREYVLPKKMTKKQSNVVKDFRNLATKFDWVDVTSLIEKHQIQKVDIFLNSLKEKKIIYDYKNGKGNGPFYNVFNSSWGIDKWEVKFCLFPILLKRLNF